MASTYYPLFHAAPPLNPPGLLTSYWWGANDAQKPCYDKKTGKWVFPMLGHNNSVAASKGQSGWIGWTTTDFHSWTPLPDMILSPIEMGTEIWTGCSFVDETNAWGYGEDAAIIVATTVEGAAGNAFTVFASPEGPLGKYTRKKDIMNTTTARAQGVPLDYADHPDWTPDFRDTSMVYDAPHDQWVLAISVSYGVAFFTAKNPQTDQFTYASYWLAPGRTVGQPGGVECPNFIYHKGQWVLAYSDQAFQFQEYNGQKLLRQTGMITMGNWDGKTFTASVPPQPLDYGWGFYAQTLFEDLNGDLCTIAWLNNWNIGGGTPQTGWQSQLTSVRKLSLPALAQPALAQQVKANKNLVLAAVPNTKTADAKTVPAATQRPLFATRPANQNFATPIDDPNGGWGFVVPLTWVEGVLPGPNDTPAVFRWGRMTVKATLKGTTWPDDGQLVFVISKNLSGVSGARILLNPHAGNITVYTGAGGAAIANGDSTGVNLYSQAPSILPYDFSGGVFSADVLLDSCSLEVFTDQGLASTHMMYPVHDQIFCDCAAPQNNAPAGAPKPTGDPVDMRLIRYPLVQPDARTWLEMDQKKAVVDVTLTDGTTQEITLPLIAGPQGAPGTTTVSTDSSLTGNGSTGAMLGVSASWLQKQIGAAHLVPNQPSDDGDNRPITLMGVADADNRLWYNSTGMTGKKLATTDDLKNYLSLTGGTVTGMTNIRVSPQGAGWSWQNDGNVVLYGKNGVALMATNSVSPYTAGPTFPAGFASTGGAFTTAIVVDASDGDGMMIGGAQGNRGQIGIRRDAKGTLTSLYLGQTDVNGKWKEWSFWADGTFSGPPTVAQGQAQSQAQNSTYVMGNGYLDDVSSTMVAIKAQYGSASDKQNSRPPQGIEFIYQQENGRLGFNEVPTFDACNANYLPRTNTTAAIETFMLGSLAGYTPTAAAKSWAQQALLQRAKLNTAVGQTLSTSQLPPPPAKMWEEI